MNETQRRRIEQWRRRVAQAIAPPALLRESMHINGRIRARELPFETEEEWRYWWLVQRNESGQIIAPSRMSEREKDRYTVAESSNILVSSGITQVLNYIGSSSGNSTAFAQYFAVGNTAIGSVNSNDSSVAGEYFRAAPSASSVSGVQVDLSTLAGTTQANGSITNCGLFGNGASSTLGSGTMMTHALFNYSKGSTESISFDYLLSYV